MKRITVAEIVFLGLLAGIVISLLFFAVSLPAFRLQFSALITSTASGGSQPSLTLEELTDLVKPSVVRVVQHVTGDVTIPAFTIDLKKLKVTLQPSKKPFTTKIDDYLTGSGFIVNPEGYIITNAHVVSGETMKVAAIAQLIFIEAFKQALSFDIEDLQNILENEEEGRAFVLQVVELLLRSGTFNLKSDIVVLKPSSQKEKFLDLLADGFRATVRGVNDQFYKDEKDIALLRIDADRLPALLLGESAMLTTGNRIFVFGFPATAEFNRKNLLESTFTQGVISAKKDSESKAFKILQTDAKVSQGSSGGPLFNEAGEVVGVVTFQTDPFSQEAGDNFAFAIPIEIAKEVLGQKFVENTAGSYRQHFLAGLSLLYERRCARALQEFEQAEAIHNDFSVEKFIQPYVDRCKQLQAAGQSLDTWWDEALERVSGVSVGIWVIAASSLLFVVVLSILIVRLVKRLRKEEKHVEELENFLVTERWAENLGGQGEDLDSRFLPSTGASLQPQEIPRQGVRIMPSQPPVQAPIDSAVAAYVRQARKTGLDDAAIRQELKKAGWPPETIEVALRS